MQWNTGTSICMFWFRGFTSLTSQLAEKKDVRSSETLSDLHVQLNPTHWTFKLFVYFGLFKYLLEIKHILK